MFSSRHRGRALGAGLVLLVLAACGGTKSGGSGSASSIACSGDAAAAGLGEGELCVDSGFRLSKNDFAFPNWSGIEGDTDDMDTGTLIRLFGAATVCTSGTTADDCVLNPSAESTLAQWASALDGGRCEGMSTLALRYFLGLQDPSEAESGSSDAVALQRPQLTIDQEINTWWATQFMPEVRSAAAESRKLEPVALVARLIDGLKKKTGYTIGIYGNGYGHSVTPFAVTKNAGVYSIHIYDNNYPGKNAAITVDEKTNKWSYDEAAVNPDGEGSTWSGGKGTIELTPMDARKGPFSEEFGAVTSGVKGSAILGVAVKSTKGQPAAGLLVTTASGKHAGIVNSQIVSDIPGVVYTVGKGGLGTSLVTLEIPELSESYSVQVVSANGESDAGTRSVTLSVTTADGSRTQINSERALDTRGNQGVDGAEVIVDPANGVALAPKFDSNVTVSNNKDKVVVKVPKNGKLTSSQSINGPEVDSKDAAGQTIVAKKLKKAAVRLARAVGVTSTTHTTLVPRSTSTTLVARSTTTTLVRRSTTTTTIKKPPSTTSTVVRTSTTVPRTSSTTTTTLVPRTSTTVRRITTTTSVP